MLDLKHCLNIAKLAAYSAGNRIMHYFGRPLEVSSKNFAYEKSDVVTVADHESQTIIQNLLLDFNSSIGFLAEEFGQNQNHSRFEKDYFWSVDPLDGTKAFISRNTGFAVSIGLTARDGSPILGVAYFPAFSDLYCASIGSSALLNDQIFRINDKRSKKIKILLSEAESLPAKNNAIYHEIYFALKTVLGYTSISAETISAPVHKAIMVANNDCDVLYYGIPRPTLGVSIWDFSAVVPICLAAGAAVTDVYLSPLELNRAESTFIHHKGFIFSSRMEINQVVSNILNRFDIQLSD